jgi:hypothetical protein
MFVKFNFGRSKLDSFPRTTVAIKAFIVQDSYHLSPPTATFGKAVWHAYSVHSQLNFCPNGINLVLTLYPIQSGHCSVSFVEQRLLVVC